MLYSTPKTATVVRSTAIALLLAASAGVVRAAPASQPASQPTTAPVVDAETVRFIEKLADPDPAARDAAQRELLESPVDGETLAAALRAARQDAAHQGDLDFKLRLDTLLVQAQERVDVGPTRITIHVKDAPLGEVLAEFTKQGKANFADLAQNFGGGPDGIPKVTLDLDRVPFWTAIKKMQEEAKVSVYAQGGDGAWRIYRSGGGPQGIQGQESGAFLIQPINANYSRSVSYQGSEGGSANENFYFQFAIFAEPKIKLDAAQGVLTVDRAVDSNGNDLIGPQRSIPIGVPGNGSNMISCGLQLKYPQNNPGERFAELSGTIKVLMARRTQSLSSDDLLNEAAPLRITTAEGVTLAIQPKQKKAGENANDVPVNGPANPNAPRQDLELVATIDGADTAAVDRLGQILQQARVTDERGTRLNLSSFSQTRESTSHLEVRVSYSTQPRNMRRVNVNAQPNRTDDDADDAKPKPPKIKFQLDVPTSVRQLEIPFTMKDMKMP